MNLEKMDEPTDKLVSIPEYPLINWDEIMSGDYVPPSDVPINRGSYAYLLDSDGFTECCTMVANSDYWKNK